MKNNPNPIWTIVSLTIRNVNLSDEWMIHELKQFQHLRKLCLNFDRLAGNDDVTLNLESDFEHLTELCITPDELQVTTEMNEVRLNLIIPEGSKLQKLEIQGLILMDSFWAGISQSVPKLIDFTYCVSNLFMNLLGR